MAGPRSSLIRLMTWLCGLSTLLFGVQPFDVPTYAVVGVILVVAVLLAVIVPARRAPRVDPIVALRTE